MPTVLKPTQRTIPKSAFRFDASISQARIFKMDSFGSPYYTLLWVILKVKMFIGGALGLQEALVVLPQAVEDSLEE